MTPDSLRVEWKVPPAASNQEPAASTGPGENSVSREQIYATDVASQAEPARGEDLIERVLRELRDERMEPTDDIEIPVEEHSQSTSNLAAVRAGEERAATIRRRHAMPQEQGPGTEAGEDRTTFFIRNMMMDWPQPFSGSRMKQTATSVPDVQWGKRGDSTRLEPN